LATKGNEKTPQGVPSRDKILQFLTDNPYGGGGKREIGKAFGLKGAAKIGLKAVLKDMLDDGTLEKQGKRLVPGGQLAQVLVLDIVERDRDGDLIAIPANWDESRGDPPKLEIVQAREKSHAAGIGSKVLARQMESREDKGRPRAKVMKLLAKQKPVELGVVRKAADGSLRIMPVEKRRTEMLISQGGDGGAVDGDLVEVTTSKAPVRSSGLGLPRATVRNILGKLDNEYAVTTIALHDHGIPHTFPDAVLENAEAVLPITKPGPREDWRDLPLITIDPADAKDHDDAVYAIPDDDPTNPGGHIVYVAIADVAAYVTTDSPMDREALKRGNSVYFPDRVVPMLPERISNDLCSLREKEDRPALAVKMVFEANGQKRRHSFHRIFMRSHAKLAYEEAQKAIEGTVSDRAADVLASNLKPLWAAYECLKRGRDNREPLEIDVPERKILLNKDGTVKDVIVPPRLDAHKLIEEFMIQANVAAAETLERKQAELIYRTHDSPTLSRLEALQDFLKSLDMKIAKGAQLRPHHFNGILRAVAGSDKEELVNNVVLRSQSQAIYDTHNLGHFGLNLKKYAHFTSPIRRYADLTVHRALIAALGFGDDGMTGKQAERLKEIAADISDLERRAMSAERQTKDRLIAQHLSSRIGAEFGARIGGVTKSGLFVTLNETGADGFVPIRSLGDEYFHFDEARHLVVGEQSGEGFQMGDPVTVRLVEAAPVAGALRFEMVSEGKTGYGLERSRPSNAKRGRSNTKRGTRPSAKRGGRKSRRS
jgi:ribonuclease R